MGSLEFTGFPLILVSNLRFQVTGQTLTKSKNEYTKQLLSDMGKLLGIIHFLSVGLRTLFFLLVEKFAEEVLRLRQWQDEDPGLSEQRACR